MHRERSRFRRAETAGIFCRTETSSGYQPPRKQLPVYPNGSGSSAGGFCSPSASCEYKRQAVLDNVIIPEVYMDSK